MEENILKELVKSRNVLKKKFKSVKLGDAETLNKLENTFKPLTEPLQKLVELSSDNSPKIKLLVDEKTKIKNIDDSITTPKKYVLKREHIDSSPKSSESNKRKHNKNNEDDEDTELNSDSFYSQSSDLEFDLTEFNENKKLDTTYGPYKNVDGNWKFGSSDLKLSDDKITIGNKSWAITPGLYSLIFHIKPEQYDSSELEIYKRILLDTNAHRRNYNANNQLKGNKGYKYKHIINKLFPTTHIGKGLMKVNLQKPNYIYWDNPNEIVERLKLLMASQHAGNNNHTNEIISIIEELREANIIE